LRRQGKKSKRTPERAYGLVIHQKRYKKKSPAWPQSRDREGKAREAIKKKREGDQSAAIGSPREARGGSNKKPWITRGPKGLKKSLGESFKFLRRGPVQR